MRTRSRGKKVSATGIVLYIVVVHTAASVSLALQQNSLKATTSRVQRRIVSRLR